MKNILTVLKRELGAYFNSPIAYIYLIVFIALNNGLFMTRYFLAGKADMQVFFDTLPLVLFIFIPVITMRLWAEDKREHTFEMLLTLPMKPQELVLGKFFASLVFYAIALASTLSIPVILRLTGQPDSGAIIGGYAGAFFTGTLFLALGIFVSGLADEQIVAFVITTLSCFVLFFLGTDYFASSIDGWIPGLGTFLMANVGVASHAGSFSRGVIDVKDIIYFAAASSVFLVLNGLFLEGRLRPKSKLVFTGAVAACLIGVVTFNWLIHDLDFGRMDITQDKIYTVSDVSKKVLRELKAPLLVNLYITPADKMPTAYKTLEQDIAGKLQELKVSSNNKFSYKIFHIEAAKLLEEKKKESRDASANAQPDSLEASLQDKGISPFQVESIDKDEMGLKLVYSAMSIAYMEKKEEVLPRILPQTLPDLEYLIFSRVLKLTQAQKPVVAMFSPPKNRALPPELSVLLGEKNDQVEDEYQTIPMLLRNNGYEVERVSLDEGHMIPEGVKTLIVLNSGTLNDRQIFELNKFLYQGGSVLLSAQGYEYDYNIVPPSGLELRATKLSDDINRLIKKWGVSINGDMLMDESDQMIEISSGQRVGPFALSMPARVPNQILVKDPFISKNVPFVMRLSSLLYLWGSALDVSDELIDQARLKKTVLFTSSDRSWEAPYHGGNIEKESLEFPAAGSRGKYPLGLLLEGNFSNIFEGQDMPEWPKTGADAAAKDQAAAAPPKAKAVMENPMPGKLIIIGCARMFNNDLITNSGNLGLFGNIIDGLCIGSDIITIRAKSYVSRDIRKVSDNQKVLYRFAAVFLVPLGLALFALARLFLRRKEKQFFVKAQER